jgi:translocation and assembly module TamA
MQLPRPPRRVLVALTAALLGVASMARAADPVAYTVTLQPTGDPTLDAALHDASNLISLRETAPAGPFALVGRAQEDLGRLDAALHSFGYYKAKISIRIGGHPLDETALPDELAQAPAEPPQSIDITIDHGPLFHIGKVALDGQVPADIAERITLQPGEPATAASVLAAQAQLLTMLQTAGYALAKVELPPSVLHPQENLLDVTYQVAAGSQLNIGPIRFSGLDHMHEDFVRQQLLLHPGDRYSPAAIEAARTDLTKLGVFSSVRAEPAEQVDADGLLPITINVTERPLHTVDLGASYSTDLGANLTAGWHDRNLFGNAEQLNVTGAIQLGGSAVQKPGYSANVQFIKPDFLVHDQSLELDVGAIKQSLQAYDQQAVTQKAALSRILSPHWTATVGVTGEQEEITQEGVSQRYDLIGVPVSVKYDDTTSLLDPTSGVRAALLLTPTASLNGQTGYFTIGQLSGSTYIDVLGNGRSVVALRGLVGEVFGVSNQFSLPPDQRFYAGGSATVRGYRYQSIGPQFPDNKPTGGTVIGAGTVEYRQRILDKFGVVAFVDAGQVTARGTPFDANWRVGTGVGVRYYTPIGPIRLDVAVPVNRLPGGDAFELYIGIGQAF